jgi:hypothetical protein
MAIVAQGERRAFEEAAPQVVYKQFSRGQALAP